LTIDDCGLPIGKPVRLAFSSNRQSAIYNRQFPAMPELPDIVVYVEALEARILGQRLERVRLASPFLLRTVTPPIQALEANTVQSLRRVGKRIAIGLANDCWLVLHLMIAGRLHWRENPAPPRSALLQPGILLNKMRGTAVSNAGLKPGATPGPTHGATAQDSNAAPGAGGSGFCQWEPGVNGSRFEEASIAPRGPR